MLITTAFKEWASIVQALGAGEQILILRKGGLQDPDQTFQMKSSFFALFPTFEHQQPQFLKSFAAAHLQSQHGFEDPRTSPRIHFQFAAQVTRDWTIEDESVLKRLDSYHGWSEEAIHQKFSWGTKRQIHVLELRVYGLDLPVEVINETSYHGCKSWVDLTEPIDVRSMHPVLSDDRFQTLQRLILL